MKRKLAVCDLDGTLFDTAEVNYLSYHAAAEKCGYQIDKDEFMAEFEGKNYKDFLPVFGICDRDVQEKIHDEKKMLYADFLKNARKNEHLFEMLATMKEEYYLAVATTASKRNASEILECFGVMDLFDFMISQEDVSCLKPNPECYLLAMKKVNVKPEDTVVFEDSAVGLQAAFDSGASVMKVERF